MNDIKLPPMMSHPECHTYAWTDQEKAAIRARDLEVAKAVLEAAARVLSATYLELQDGVYVELPSFDGGKDCASAIRNLEISHD